MSATHSANNNRIIMNTEDNSAVSNTITAINKDNNHEPDALVVTASHNNVLTTCNACKSVRASKR